MSIDLIDNPIMPPPRLKKVKKVKAEPPSHTPTPWYVPSVTEPRRTSRACRPQVWEREFGEKFG